MSFVYNYERAKANRIPKYRVQNAIRYINQQVPAMLAGSSHQSQTVTKQAPDWVIERIVSEYYKLSPELRGKLPAQWCQAIDHITIMDKLTTLVLGFPTQYVPRTASFTHQSVFTKEEQMQLGLHSEKTAAYDDAQKLMAPMRQFITQTERCVPIVLLQRNPWMLDLLPSNLVGMLTDEYTDRILSHHRKEFDSLPPRKDVQKEPPAELADALSMLNIIKLKDH